jgi:hypothetical protein
MSDVMRDEPDFARVDPRQGGLEKARRVLDVKSPKAFPGVHGDVAIRVEGEGRVVGVCDRVDLGGLDPSSLQAKASSPPWDLPGAERHRFLAVLAPGKALLLGCSDYFAVYDEGGGGVMKDSVDSEDQHLKPKIEGQVIHRVKSASIREAKALTQLLGYSLG